VCPSPALPRWRRRANRGAVPGGRIGELLEHNLKPQYLSPAGDATARQDGAVLLLQSQLWTVDEGWICLIGTITHLTVLSCLFLRANEIARLTLFGVWGTLWLSHHSGCHGLGKDLGLLNLHPKLALIYLRAQMTSRVPRPLCIF
jgi:hypothetical protein